MMTGNTAWRHRILQHMAPRNTAWCQKIQGGGQEIQHGARKYSMAPGNTACWQEIQRGARKYNMAPGNATWHHVDKGDLHGWSQQTLDVAPVLY